MMQWKRIGLGELCQVKTGKYDVNHAIDNGMYPFYTCALQPFKANTYSFDGELIMLPGNGANVGEVMYYNGKIEAYQRTYVLHSFKANVKYVYYFLKSVWKRTLQNQQYGSATNYIRLNNITDLLVPLPPLHIQEQIADTLDKADALRRKDQELLDKYDELAQSTFYDMFGDPVRNEKGWIKQTLSKVIRIETTTVKPEETVGKYYIGLENIEKDTGKLTISTGIDLKSNKFLFDQDCILYGKLRPYLKKVAIPDFNGVCSTDIFPIRCISVNKEFIATILRSEHFTEYATSSAVGANLPRVNKDTILSYVTICPPMEIQDKFSKKVRHILKMKTAINNNINTSESLQSQLLASFFS